MVSATINFIFFSVFLAVAHVCWASFALIANSVLRMTKRFNLKFSLKRSPQPRVTRNEGNLVFDWDSKEHHGAPPETLILPAWNMDRNDQLTYNSLAESTAIVETMEKLAELLSGLNLMRAYIAQDSDCFYNAIRCHVSTPQVIASAEGLRFQVADYLNANKAKYAELREQYDDARFDAYISRIRNEKVSTPETFSIDALSRVLKRPIVIIRTSNAELVIIENEDTSGGIPIHLLHDEENSAFDSLISA